MRLKGPLGCVIKVLLLISIVMLIGFVVLQVTGGSCVKRENNSVPPIEKAAWEVKTPTHVYYSEGVKQTDVGVIMINWWENRNNKWILRKGDYLLQNSIYGQIKVIKRSDVK